MNRIQKRNIIHKFNKVKGLRKKHTKGASGKLPEYIRDDRRKKEFKKNSKLSQKVETKQVTKKITEPVEDKQVTIGDFSDKFDSKGNKI